MFKSLPYLYSKNILHQVHNVDKTLENKLTNLFSANKIITKFQTILKFCKGQQRLLENFEIQKAK